MSETEIKIVCHSARVCQIVWILSEMKEAWIEELGKEMDICEVSVGRILRKTDKYGLITSRFVEKTSGPGGPRRYYFLTEKGKRQAKLIKACNEHLLSP
jgi:DNA-binding PadR family transcriptional regulator